MHKLKALFLLGLLGSSSLAEASTLLHCLGQLRKSVSSALGIHPKLFRGASPISVLPVTSADKPFVQDTFGASNYGQSSNHKADERFQNWAVDTAHKGIEARRNGKNYREIYDLMIQARSELGDGDASRGVVFRKPSEGTVDHLAWKKRTSEKTEHRNDLYPYAAKIVENRSVKENIYTKRSGERVPLSSVVHLNMNDFRSTPDTILRTTKDFEDRGEAILLDVSARLEDAENAPSLDKKIDEFSRAFYGLASLSPLKKGNSAIARVYMTSAAYRIFGKNISLYPDLTIEAMLRSEDQFLEMMRSNLRSQL